MSELGLDVITYPIKRLVCLLRGHRPGPVDRYWGAACQRCGRGVIPPSFRHGGPPIGRAIVTEDEHGILAQIRQVEQPVEQPVTLEQVQETVERFADLKPEPARHLVRDPNDRLWLLGDDGRVNHEVSDTEVESWADWTEPTDVPAHSEMQLHLPSPYRGIPYSISRVDWAEYVKLGGPPPGPPNPPRAPKDKPVA